METQRSHAFPAGGTRLVARALRTALIASILSLGGLASAQAQTTQTPPAASPPAASAPQPAAAQPVKMDPQALLLLTRTFLMALDQANKTGNYSVLRDLGSPDFVVNNSVAHLADTFALQRNQRLDMSNAAILEPQITLQPQVEPNGMLHFAGFYPAGANQLKFEFLLQAVNQQWRLYGLAVNLAQAGASPADAKAPPANPPAATNTNAPAPTATPSPAAPTPAAPAPGAITDAKPTPDAAAPATDVKPRRKHKVAPAQ